VILPALPAPALPVLDCVPFADNTLNRTALEQCRKVSSHSQHSLTLQSFPPPASAPGNISVEIAQAQRPSRSKLRPGQRGGDRDREAGRDVVLRSRFRRLQAAGFLFNAFDAEWEVRYRADRAIRRQQEPGTSAFTESDARAGARTRTIPI
jgi:hypothetical protein